MNGKLAIGWILVMMVILTQAKASHIVGGEMTYRCLGSPFSGYTRYEVRLDIYQDCLTGLPDAIAQDNPAFIGVYNTNGTPYTIDSIGVSSTFIVPPNFSNSCINNIPPVCLRKATFIRVYDLPNNSTGYLIVYQRCCRNGTIINIGTPDQIGATYFCRIPPVASASAACNNSAVFKNYPPQIICINNPLFYDHSAVDPDGDSLSYEFCETFIGGSNANPKPIPTPPPYATVVYNLGFGVTKPMAGSPVVQINATTGMISGTPNLVGRFVVTVCCHEWRNGVIINTVKREFQFEVTNCSKAVVANIPQYSDEFNTYIVECQNFTVNFDNLSTGGFAYFWDFGVPGMNNDTSADFSPTFTYPDTGVYIVKLVVNRGSTCPDSISRFVKVFPTFTGYYNYEGLPCPNSPIQFRDSSQSSLNLANYWLWDFGDSTTSDLQHPSHSFSQGGTYDVVLISKNPKGCSDTVRQEVFIENFRPFAGNDTIIVKGESINFNAQGGSEYTWTPATHLSNPNIGNPVGYYPDTGRFSYNVHIKSPFQCEGDDSIKVWVVNQAALFVPTGFTPNGDGRNEILKPFGIGYRNIQFFRIFNRWGQQMFYTTQFNEGWDGRWKGEPQDIGTYHWVLSIINRFGKEEIIKGDSALIR
jgi:gliding motility-associated-like protein